MRNQVKQSVTWPNLGPMVNCHAIAVEPATHSRERVYSMLRKRQLEHRCALHQVALCDASGQTRMSLPTPDAAAI